MDLLGQTRMVDGQAVGEIFVDLADGATMAVVVRRGNDGEMRVEVKNPGDRVCVDVFVNQERVYERVPF